MRWQTVCAFLLGSSLFASCRDDSDDPPVGEAGLGAEGGDGGSLGGKGGATGGSAGKGGSAAGKGGSAAGTAGAAGAGDAGQPGTGGESGAGVGGGAGDAGGSGGQGGSGAGAGAGGEAGDAGTGGEPACGLGDACCSASTCDGGFRCLGETCSCIDSMHGNHYLRTDGTVVYYGGPTVVIVEDSSGAPLDGVLEIYQGTRHGCGLRSGGTVWCWGLSASANTSGELGNGTFTATATLFRATQVQMDTGSVSAALTNVTHLSGGSSRCYLATNTCAVRGDGSLYCWGSADASGGGGGTLFNDGVVGARNLATPILAAAAVPLDGVEAVSLGGRHACVLRNGGEVWCWAANVGGPLGQGDETGRVYPVRVTLPGAATKVGAGADVTCALVSGSVYCWGSNNSGQVGIGLPSANSDGCINFCKRTPAQVIDASAAPLGGVLDLNVAYLSVCATLSDHSLLCWGAGIANVATPFAISATPVVNVAQHTSCGSSQLDSSIRFLTRDDQLRTPFGTTTQQCP